MTSRILLLASLLMPLASGSFFAQAPCGAPCPNTCGGGCPPAPLAVCPQYPPCAGAATAAYAAPPQQQQQYSEQFVQQPLQQHQQVYAQQPPQYTQGVQQQQPLVIDLGNFAGAKTGEYVKVAPQVTYLSLPNGGSRLIVPPGSDVYALNAGAGAPYQYAPPTVVYRTAHLPAGGYAAVEKEVDEMDLKGMEWGIPLKPTEQKRDTIEAIEQLADAADEDEEEKLIRKVRSLVNDDVISREDKEEAKKDIGELISSDEEVEMIGGAGGDEADEDIEEVAQKKSKKHAEKIKKSRRSSKVARAESDAVDAVERNNDDLDRKKCNSRRLYEIMLENMNESSASSKRSINNVAEAEFGTSIDVICSRGHFSYVFSSNLYCEASKGHVTCIAFRQAPPTTVEA